MMEQKKFKLEILKNQSDLINKKLIAFIAIAGGSWAFGSKDNFSSFLSLLALFIFFLGAFGTFNSFLKLAKIEKEMGDLKNGD